ncbi:hypothetical protein ACFL6X_01110 [Candidatus Latescibacterota bacterium]
MLRSRTDHPILPLDKPWEAGGRASAVSVVPDPDGQRLRLYYLALFRDDPVRNLLCVAHSTDGYEWSKPDLGDGTNVVMRSSGLECNWGVFMATRVFLDPEEEDPERRWKMVYWERLSAEVRPGICTAASPDGLRWTPLVGRPAITGANDAMSAIAARPGVKQPFGSGRYLLYQQTWKYNPQLPRERDNLKGMHRRVSVWSGSDFQHWTGPITVLEPDGQDPSDLQFYWLSPFHTETGYGGLLFCHHTGDQHMDLQLVTSPDGWSWDRALGRQPLLPVGERGRWDCGMVTASGEPVRWGEKVLLHYNGRATVHDGQPRYPDDPLPQSAGGIGVAQLDPAVLL